MAEAEQKKGLEGVVIADTKLSRVQGDIGKLTYCGYDIKDLAAHASFEEVVFLLWYNALPTKVQLERFRQGLIDDMSLPALEIEAMKRFPSTSKTM